MKFGLNMGILRNAATVIGVLAAMGASAQTNRITGEEWKNPGIGSVGTAPARSEFISFDIRENAEKGARTNSPFFLQLKPQFITDGARIEAKVAVEIPYMWLDREVFLHVAGIGPCYLKVNGQLAGYVGDSRTPAEFNVSRWLTDGDNTVTFELQPGAKGLGLESTALGELVPDVYIYSQPKVRIDDFKIDAGFDTLKHYTVLKVEVALANDYNSPEDFKIGYDIYAPDGKTLIYYDMKEVSLPGNGRDTVVFEHPIYQNMKNVWSAEKPTLFDLILNISYDKRWIEYIPFKVGFGETLFENGTLTRNGTPIAIKAVRYNATDKTAAAKELTALKKAGYNTIWPDYPQPLWFYDLAQTTGLYVIEQANINSTYKTDDRDLGGAYSNDPAWLGSMLDRAQAAYARVAGRPCIIAWSIGGDVGNGYNMYKVYQWFKSTGDLRPVIFNDAGGEWNSDMDRIPVAEAKEVLARTAQTTSTKRR